MCFNTKTPKKPTTPGAPPPPPSEEKAQTPDLGDTAADELSLRARRKGRTGLVVGLNKPSGSGLNLRGLF